MSIFQEWKKRPFILSITSVKIQTWKFIFLVKKKYKKGVGISSNLSHASWSLQILFCILFSIFGVSLIVDSVSHDCNPG